jgi:hypothetical protein
MWMGSFARGWLRRTKLGSSGTSKSGTLCAGEREALSSTVFDLDYGQLGLDWP